MGVRGQALAVRLLAVAEQLLLAQPTFEEGSRIDARRAVTLDEQQVTPVLLGHGVPEVAEADVVEGRSRLEARDVAAQLGALPVGAQDDRQRVPADDGAQPVLDRPVARGLLLLLGRNRVLVGGGQRARNVDAFTPGLVDEPVDQVVRALRAAERLHRLQGVEPLAGLGDIDVLLLAHQVLLPVGSAPS